MQLLYRSLSVHMTSVLCMFGWCCDQRLRLEAVNFTIEALKGLHANTHCLKINSDLNILQFIIQRFGILLESSACARIISTTSSGSKSLTTARAPERGMLFGLLKPWIPENQVSKSKKCDGFCHTSVSTNRSPTETMLILRTSPDSAWIEKTTSSINWMSFLPSAVEVGDHE